MRSDGAGDRICRRLAESAAPADRQNRSGKGHLLSREQTPSDAQKFTRGRDSRTFVCEYRWGGPLLLKTSPTFEPHDPIGSIVGISPIWPCSGGLRQLARLRGSLPGESNPERHGSGCARLEKNLSSRPPTGGRICRPTPRRRRAMPHRSGDIGGRLPRLPAARRMDRGEHGLLATGDRGECCDAHDRSRAFVPDGPAFDSGPFSPLANSTQPPQRAGIPSPIRGRRRSNHRTGPRRMV